MRGNPEIIDHGMLAVGPMQELLDTTPLSLCHDIQFGWLQGSRKLLKGKIFWLRGPATIRIV
jgi:hypothetical protein